MTARVAVMVAAVCCPWAAGQCQYAVTVIEAPPCGFPYGTPLSRARAINDVGQVVGYYVQCGESSKYEAFVWSAAEGFATLPRPPGVTSMQAYDVNDSGVIVGEWSRPPFGKRGFIFQDSVFAEISVDGPGAWSCATTVNNVGVVGGYRTVRGSDPGPAPFEGFILYSGEFIGFGVLSGPSSFVTGTNDSGLIVGYSGFEGGIDAVPFVVNDGKVFLLSDVFDGASATANACAADGTVVGGLGIGVDPRGNQNNRAFKFLDGLLTVLPTVPGYPAKQHFVGNFLQHGSRC